MATLCHVEHVHITQTRTRTLTLYFCMGQESESESVSSNVNDTGTDWDSDSKPDSYIVQCRICSHCTDSGSDPCSLFLYRTGIESEFESVPESVSDNVNESLVGSYTVEPRLILPDRIWWIWQQWRRCFGWATSGSAGSSSAWAAGPAGRSGSAYPGTPQPRYVCPPLGIHSGSLTQTYNTRSNI